MSLTPPSSGEHRESPAALAAPANSSPSPSDDLLNKLRQLRAELQDFLDVLVIVREGKADLPMFTTYITKTKSDIASLTTNLEDGSDAIRHILNLLEQIACNPLLTDPKRARNPQEYANNLSLLEQQINKTIYMIGYLTIPERLSRWLNLGRPGYYVPFHLVFEDEVPSAQDRMKILNFLAWSPVALKNGIVDVASGVVYRISENRGGRIMSIIGVLIGLAIATTAVVASTSITGLIPAGNDDFMLRGWLLLLLGVVVHIAVGSVKRTQSSGGLPPIMALSDIERVIDSRVGQILLKILMALIGFFGLVLTADLKTTPLFTFLLVGYSLDSFVEVFGASLDQQADAQLTLMRKKLSLEDKKA